MENQHQLIKGSRDLSQHEIDLINKVMIEANAIRDLLDKLEVNTEVGYLDYRWFNIAKTDLQKGFMALIRAIEQPTTF